MSLCAAARLLCAKPQVASFVLNRSFSGADSSSSRLQLRCATSVYNKCDFPGPLRTLHQQTGFQSSIVVASNVMGRRQSTNTSSTNSQPHSRGPSSTTSLGKRRSLAGRRRRATAAAKSEQAESKMSSSEYGSQQSPMRRPAASPSDICKVAILGAAGGIGQPLALLMMLHSEYVQHLALYDLIHVRGIGADLAHIDRQCRVTTHLGPEELAECVKNARVILIPAGLAQKPGMSRDDLFGSNAKIMYSLAKACVQHAPHAMLAIISNPVNSLVPLTCEIYSRYSKESNCTRRIFGVTTLDVIRASTLTARSAFYKTEPSGLFKDPAKIAVPVVGGHAGKTIVPLLSQATPKIEERALTEQKQTVSVLIESVQEAGIEVLNAKKGRGSATLAMAYAACRFTISLLRAQMGEPNIIECAFVKQSGLFDDLDYFATPLVLGKDGWSKSMGIGKLLPFEQSMVDEAARELKTSVARGEDFAKESLQSDL